MKITAESFGQSPFPAEFMIKPPAFLIMVRTVNFKAVRSAFAQFFRRRGVQLQILHRMSDDQRSAAAMHIIHNLPPVRQPHFGIAPTPHRQLIPIEVGDRIGAACACLIWLQIRMSLSFKQLLRNFNVGIRPAVRPVR